MFFKPIKYCKCNFYNKEKRTSKCSFFDKFNFLL